MDRKPMEMSKAMAVTTNLFDDDQKPSILTAPTPVSESTINQVYRDVNTQPPENLSDSTSLVDLIGSLQAVKTNFPAIYDREVKRQLAAMKKSRGMIKFKRNLKKQPNNHREIAEILTGLASIDAFP